MGRARGANAKIAGVFESVYGTPPTASGNYLNFPFASSGLGSEQGLQEDDLLGNGREAYDPTYDVITNDADIVVPVDVRNFGHWLKLMFGAPVTTDTDPIFSHVFASGATDLPSMSIETQWPDVPAYEMNYGVKGNQMRIAMSRRGLLNATISIVAKGSSPIIPTSNAGTIVAALNVDRFQQAKGEIQREGVKLGLIVSANIAFTNALDKLETIQPDSEIEGADGGIAMASGDLVARFDSLALSNDSTNQTPVELIFKWTYGSDYLLELTVPRVFLPRVKKPITGPGGVQATFNWQSSGENEACFQARLVNDVDAY